jgi:hypothetical protein
VVTGRHESDRDATTALLNKLDVSYSRLIMQPDDMQDSAKYKGETAKALIADGLDVVFVIENNAEARAAYKDAGVDVVLNPADLPAVSEGRNMDMNTMTELQDKAYSLKGHALETIAALAETVYDLCEIVDSMSEPVAVDPALDPAVDPLAMQQDSVRFVEPSKVAELHERG